MVLNSNLIFSQEKNPFRFFISLLFILSVFSLGTFAQSQQDRQLADQYFNNAEYEKAASLYEKLMNDDPEGTYPPYLRCLIALKQYDNAEKMIKKIIKRIPDYPAYIVDLGFVYDSKGEKDKAKQQYDKALKGITNDQGSIISLANAFLQHQELDYALQTYLEGEKIIHDNYSFNFEMAEIYYQKGDFKNMTEEYLDAVGENPMLQQNVLNILQ